MISQIHAFGPGSFESVQKSRSEVALKLMMIITCATEAETQKY